MNISQKIKYEMTGYVWAQVPVPPMVCAVCDKPITGSYTKLSSIADNDVHHACVMQFPEVSPCVCLRCAGPEVPAASASVYVAVFGSSLRARFKEPIDWGSAMLNADGNVLMAYKNRAQACQCPAGASCKEWKT